MTAPKKHKNSKQKRKTGNTKLSTAPEVSIIILNYNAERFLPKTLDSIRMQEDVVVQTIVVDNKSTDNSLGLIADTYPWVEVVKRDTSLGFSAGNNAGIPKANGDMILFFNPDIAFTTEHDLRRCLDKYNSVDRIGVMTARVNLVVNGKIDDTCHRGFPTPWAALTHFTGLEKLFPQSSLFAQYTAGYLGYDTEHQVDAVGGMFMLLSRDVGERIGWWDEEYPLYGEDIDFCYRVQELGKINYYWPGVVVEHYKGATTGMSKSSAKVTSASKETTRRVKGWSIQAMEIFYRKHYMKKYPALLNWLVMLGIRVMKFKRVTLA